MPRAMTSPVDEAVYSVLGGPTKAARALKVSRQSIYFLLGRGVIFQRAVALRIERLTAKRGHIVPAAELMGLIPWTPELGEGADADGVEVGR